MGYIPTVDVNVELYTSNSPVHTLYRRTSDVPHHHANINLVLRTPPKISTLREVKR